MNQNKIKEILQAVSENKISIEEAIEKIKFEPFTDLSFAKVDHQRELTQGVGEVIYGEGKSAEQINQIIESMINHFQERILITRLDKQKFQQLDSKYHFHYDENARCAIYGEKINADGIGKVIVACAGTSDLKVAEETRVTLEFLGNEVICLYDVGVAGIHRLLNYSKELNEASVVISIAGMEGALTSVISGLVNCPVIGVPTSVGYGASFNGLSALLAMLNSCASGVSVVNIDNGFGAAYQANLINHLKGSK